RRRVNPLRVEVESPHLAGFGMTVPSRKTKSWRVQQGVWRCHLAGTDRPKVWRRAEEIDLQQGRQPRFKPLKLANVLTRSRSRSDVPALEPMVKAANDVRNPAAISVQAARPERRDQLTHPDLLVCHGSC